MLTRGFIAGESGPKCGRLTRIARVINNDNNYAEISCTEVF